MAHKIILDVDTGSDDAVAIMAAALSPDIELVAVCSVAGNKCLDMTTENTLRVIEMLGADVPVYRGCGQPLVKFLCGDRITPKQSTRAMVGGEEVQMHADYLDLPPSTIREEDMPAPMFYVDYLRRAADPVILVAVGPLTNLAVAFLMAPDIVKKVKRIVIMGGGYKVANCTPAAEFNVWYDPEAAQRVIHCGAEVLMVPLDATHAACVSLDDCKRLRELGTPAADFAADLCRQRIVVHNALQPLEVPDSAAVHDALAVCAVVDESVLKDVHFVHCDVGCGDFGEGQTIVDTRYLAENPNCHFAFSADRHLFVDLLCDILGRSV